MNRTNLHVIPSPDNSVAGSSTNGDAPPGVSDGERTLFLCKEFLNAYPKWYLARVTSWWVFVATITGLIDWALMKHIGSARFSDAFGNATVSDWVISVAAGLTLIVFLSISFLWKKGVAK